jgi:hypothetical protein
MKQIINWIGGFFDSSNEKSSSKRLVGIVGAFTLFVTLYSNSHSEAHIAPSEALVWADVVVICTSLGLASVKEIGDMMNKIKGNNQPKTEE